MLLRRLGQTRALNVVVTDHNGRPVSGAAVTVGPTEGVTDSRGIFSVALPAGQLAKIVVRSGDYTVARDVQDGAGGDIFVELPVCVSQPLLTTAELVALLGAAGLVGAGYYWKIEPLKVTGEVLFGASVFTTIFRLSCL